MEKWLVVFYDGTHQQVDADQCTMKDGFVVFYNEDSERFSSKMVRAFNSKQVKEVQGEYKNG